jgi:hypothetical protein
MHHTLIDFPKAIANLVLLAMGARVCPYGPECVGCILDQLHGEDTAPRGTGGLLAAAKI